jgi:hypothetical protein
MRKTAIPFGLLRSSRLTGGDGDMKSVRICANCFKTLRLDSDIGLAVYGAGELGKDFLYVLDLIVPESPVGFPLFSQVYHVSFKEKMLEAEIQGRKDDEEEAAALRNLYRSH